MAVQTYLNFDLLIDPAQDGYLARVIYSPSGESSTVFRLPFSLTEIGDGLALVGGVVRHLKLGDKSDNSGQLFDARSFGTRLYTAIFGATSVGDCLRRSIDYAQSQGAGLRIHLRLKSTPELAALPWEYLFDIDNNRFFATSTQLSIVRYLELPEPVQALAVERPLRILVMIADPKNVMPRLQVEREWNRVQEALSLLEASSVVQLTRLPAATPAVLQRALRQDDYHVLHCIGHGWFKQSTDKAFASSAIHGGTDILSPNYGLVLEDEYGNEQRVSADKLSLLLQDSPHLRLSMLNTCEGARGDQTLPFAGVAQYLVQQGIPAVIAMQFPISDHTAIQLSEEFYRALADGYPADAALAEARKALYTQGSLIEWGTPVLFSRSSDNRLFDLPPSSKRPITKLLCFEPETVFIPAGSFVMGEVGDDAAVEWQAHRVNLLAYRIGKYPVTNQQYAHFARQQPTHRPQRGGWLYTNPPPEQLDHPVTGISWNDAIAYCDWLSQQTGRHYRLPSEAEWEKAARGVQDQRPYPWGERLDPANCNMQSNSTTPVHQYTSGISSLGCYDMIGNVREWTNTIWGDEPTQPTYTYPYRCDEREAKSPSGLFFRIWRGGAYDDSPDLLGCSTRGFYSVNAHLHNVGFRVVLDFRLAQYGD